MSAAEELRRKSLLNAFQMPSVQTMVSRKSSITNAFVSAIIPVIPPTFEEVEQALAILEIDPCDTRCAYCGNASTEWDHLRPLVVDRRPTGYISEIANLVPACGKCNQSKGNKLWQQWIVSGAKHSPTGRGLLNVHQRVARLEVYEQWRTPTKVDFKAILGPEKWEEYWKLCEDVVAELRECQRVADDIKSKILTAVSPDSIA